jgi:hypothetical protein
VVKTIRKVATSRFGTDVIATAAYPRLFNAKHVTFRWRGYDLNERFWSIISVTLKYDQYAMHTVDYHATAQHSACISSWMVPPRYAPLAHYLSTFLYIQLL